MRNIGMKIPNLYMKAVALGGGGGGGGGGMFALQYGWENPW